MKRIAKAGVLALLLLVITLNLWAQCIIPANGTNVQTVSYSALAADAGKLIVMNCASACTLTLPNPPPTNVWFVLVSNIGVGGVTIARNSLNIDGAALNLAMNNPGMGLIITTDGTNYYTSKGVATVALPRKLFIPLAECDNGTANPVFDFLAARTIACYGTNTKVGVWQAADADTATISIPLPSDWTGSFDAKLYFNSPDTSGTVIFNLASGCVSLTGASADDPSYNASSAFATVTLASPANASWSAAVTGVTMTGCTASSWGNFKLTRATDTATSRVNVKGIEITERGAM